MESDLDEVLSSLITAFHILHQQGILDEDGQISVRNPHNPSTFFTSNLPAILVASKSHLNQWNVSDGSVVTNPHHGCQIVEVVPENSEHFIHSCIYDRYPGVQSIVHSHNLTSIVYGLCNSHGSMLQPTYQMAGFLGTQCPIFNVADYYSALPPNFPRNLLINHQHLGDALAQEFDDPTAAETDGAETNGLDELPGHNVVFLRGHGFATWAPNIRDAVYRAIHACRDAQIQSASMMQRDGTDLEAVYLSKREAIDCERTINRAFESTWWAWVAQVERSGQYENQERRRSWWN